MKKRWHHCHAASMAGGRYSIIEDAALVTEGARIAWVGPRAELPAGDYGETVDLGQCPRP
jgi:imidazolonepropionase